MVQAMLRRHRIGTIAAEQMDTAKAEQCLSQSKEHFSKRLGDDNPITGEVHKSTLNTSSHKFSDVNSTSMLQCASPALGNALVITTWNLCAMALQTSQELRSLRVCGSALHAAQFKIVVFLSTLIAALYTAGACLPGVVAVAHAGFKAQRGRPL